MSGGRESLPPPPSGGGLEGAWRRLRSLPLWLQIVLWIALWPALAALLLARSPKLGAAGIPAAVGVLLVGGLAWTGFLVGPDTKDDLALQEAAEAATPTPTPTPSAAEETPEPTPTPASTLTPTPMPTPTPEATATATPTEAVVTAAEGEMEVHFIDVGQGDATLLRSPSATVLVDAGRHNASDLHDAALAFRVTWGDVRLLFTGDAEAGRHGSTTSASGMMSKTKVRLPLPPGQDCRCAPVPTRLASANGGGASKRSRPEAGSLVATGLVVTGLLDSQWLRVPSPYLRVPSPSFASSKARWRVAHVPV
jgi:hypothetical protein